MTKIVFMGTPAFSVPILEGLVEKGYEVVLVVTQPDRKVGRKKLLTPPPVKECAQKLGIRVLQPEKIAESKEMQEILSTEVDVIVTAAFGQFLPECLLAHALFGAINCHASLLPKYRGGAPVHYALLNGEDETGVSIMRMVKKMDAGNILAVKKIPILDTDNVGTLFEKLSWLARSALLEMLPDFLEGKTKEIPQDEDKVTFSPNITSEQEEINWHKTSQELFNQVRAFFPWPIAHTYLNGQRVKIQQVSIVHEKSKEAVGTVIERGKKTLKVACGKNTTLAIEKLQPMGKKALSIEEFLNGVGRNLKVGDTFGREA